ncbi:MAG: phosphoribosylanthranilate isomerase [Dysgonamonadaceae bacterium]|jgi:phosphoribosylanthranilate isomerase|nr:phosphoribosylanthranilate isomerase [Dysgonamonadaceae bacterium]
MKIKVCGLKDPDNIRAVSRLPIEMMGFIFYPKSLRYAGLLHPEALSVIPLSIMKVGVFVNEPEASVVAIMEKYRLQAVQLHGDESPSLCRQLKKRGYVVIKSFNVATAEDFIRTNGYEDACDYFLFDAKTPLYGGSGKQYDWHILHDYHGKIPFFLSGGIGSDDFARLKSFDHPGLYAIDLNSRFETAPGIKDIELLNSFNQKIK